MLNRAILMGRLTKDPEMRYTPNGVEVTVFTLAVNRSRSKNAQQGTDFIDIVAWRGTAKFVYQYFNKGQLVAVEGQIQTRTYKDKQGSTHKVFEVVADQVHFAEGKPMNQKQVVNDTAKPQEQSQGLEPQESSLYGDFEELTSDEDLPF